MEISVKKDQFSEQISPALVKDRNVNIRITGEEYESLTQFCKENRISKSELTRKLILQVV